MYTITVHTQEIKDTLFNKSVNKSHLNVTGVKTFLKPKYVCRHEHIYTREKPYKCQFCEKRFSKKDYFICHKCILCLLVDLIQIPSQETIF